MIPRHPNRTVPAFLLAALLAVMAGCSGRDLASLEEATAEADPVVFDDAFGNTLDYSAFLDSYYEALSIDDETTYLESQASLRVDVPAGTYAGGAFWTYAPRDLSSFNALTFYARSDVPLLLNECGFGIDVNGTSLFRTRVTDVELTETWTRVVIPIPDPARLTNERGMFWYSEAEAGGAAVTVWFDDVRFANVPTITDPRPEIAGGTVEGLLGERVPVTGTQTTFAVDGEDVVVEHGPDYFGFDSSDESVARTENGVVTVVGGGTATITARLGEIAAAGELVVTIPPPPAGPAPAPTEAPGDVISLFSDAYDDIGVDTWYTDWSAGLGVFDQQIDGDNVKAYPGLDAFARYVGIDFQSNQVDATGSGMTHLHLDVYDRTATLFYVELIDFGPDGVFSPEVDDTAQTLSFFSLTEPAFLTGEWSSLDIPLSLFSDRNPDMNFGNLSQMVIRTGDGSTVYVDNVYFHR